MTDIVEQLNKEIVRTVELDLMHQKAADEIKRLRKVEAAAKNLVAVKGRHHSEQAYQKLVEALKDE